MSLIFDSFPSKTHAENFAREVERLYNRPWEVLDEHPPFRAPVVHISRTTLADEYDFAAEPKIMKLARNYRGRFQGT